MALFAVSAEGRLRFGSISSLATTLDEEDVWDLLTSQDLCVAEDQLLHLVKTWCKRHRQPEVFQKMIMHIDFGLLTHEQVST